MIIKSIYRYPVKGLSPEELPEVEVAAGKELPSDRAFAIAHGDSEFDPAAPRHLAKTNFLMLMRDERLAALKTSLDHGTGILTIATDDGEQFAADIGTGDGRRQFERFLTGFMGEDVTGRSPLRIVQAPDHMFSDVAAKCLSLVNLASVRALEAEVGAQLDPLRFRANIYFDGAPAWEEMDWAGRMIEIGEVRLMGLKTTQRCAATNVNPATAKRDQNIPRSLMKAFGHADMGVYAEVVSGGVLKPGDALRVG